MIAIKINTENKVIYQHYRPELIDTAGMIIVDTIPQPEDKDGYCAELYYTADKGFWYEYLPLPTVEEPIPELDISYDYLVEQKIRQRYTISAEFAVLRQKEDKPIEYQQYYDYCEQCKADAKQELGLV